MKKFAVIVAGGAGSRMDSDTPKQFMKLNGKPVVWYSINAFLDAYDDLEVILVLPADHIKTGMEIILTTVDPQRVRIAEGGLTRFHSVKNGLALVEDNSIVFVHDAVRCLISEELISRCYEHALANGNAIPAVHATDTIRIDNGHTALPVDRNKVYIIQTPQTFQSEILKEAFGKNYLESFTDEATVAEFAGYNIHLVEGERTNIKITWPVDLAVAEAILKGRGEN
jgi:2-C-methyl-D-erythritol 4-phosphate cytidylyltransferase